MDTKRETFGAPWKLSMLFLLIEFAGSQLSNKRPSQAADVGEEPLGLCPNAKLSNDMHPLAEVSSFFHTPWLDAHFCSYPQKIHADIPDDDLECSSANNTQQWEQMVKVCEKLPSGTRARRLRELRLPFCSNYPAANVFGSQDDCVMKGDRDKCVQCMRNIYQIDQHVKFVYCHFAKDIMARFDCQNKFSIKWNCSHCQEAYKQWLCSMMIPFRMGDYLIEPCRTFCTMVEQRCPYLTPDDRIVWAGEPVFFCKDPDIPEIYSAYSDPPHCYQPCHLDPNLEPKEACDHHELLIEELATYYNMSKRRTSSLASIKTSSFINLLTVLSMIFVGSIIY